MIGAKHDSDELFECVQAECLLIKTQADKSGKNDRDDAILNLEVSELEQSHTQHCWLGEIFDFSGPKLSEFETNDHRLRSSSHHFDHEIAR